MWNYILRGPDPMGVAVLLEDSAAIIGVLIATAATSLCWYTGSVVPDAIGSIMIGTLLGATAVFLIQKNTKALLGQSMPTHKRDLLINILMADPVGSYQN
jgi:solute carrier family 30 (zinc transporter), member 9